MKKMIPFVVAAAVFAATPTYAATSFTDIQKYDETTQQAVNYLVDKQIIKGTSATTFSPAREITRGQVVKMLGRYLQSTGKQVPSNWETVARFTDVPTTTADRELLQYAALVYDEKVFVGSNGKLNASGMLTRENLVLVLSRLAKDANLEQYVKDKGLTSNVKDLAAVKDEAKAAVELFNALQISNVETFNPKNNVLRVHFASFLAKLLQTVEKVEQESTQPGGNEEPTTPGESEESTTPDESEEPTTPGESEEPATPGESEEPATPGESEEPATPGESEEPATPGESEESTTPGENEEPTTPDEDDEETEESYVFEFEDVENAKIIATSATSVTISHGNHTSVKLGVAPELAKVFSQSAMLTNAIASLTIDEDVITSLNALEIVNNGSSTAPITVDGSLFEEFIPIVIRSQYANIVAFDEYYETVIIKAPANAVYAVGTGEFETITASGPLTITFTGSIESELILDAPSAQVTIAKNAFIETLIAKNELSITVQQDGALQDLYLPAHVSTLTVYGDIANVNVETTGSFTLNGTGNVYGLFGNATAVYVQANGVTVDDLYVDPSVEEVTVK